MKRDVGPVAVEPNSWTANGVTKLRDDVPVWLVPQEVRRPLVMRALPDDIKIGRHCVASFYTSQHGSVLRHTLWLSGAFNG